MQLIITRSDLTKIPCKRYDNLPYQFDAIFEIKKRGNYIGDYIFLINNCEKAQTLEMVEYLKVLKFNYRDISSLIRCCDFAANSPEIRAYFNYLIY